MIYYDVGELIVASIPKNAGTSIRHTLYKHLNVNEVSSDDLSNKPIITFIRNPIERLQSCFWKFSNTSWPIGNYTTYNSFVDSILDGIVDRHWAHQINFLLGNELVYQFEDIDNVFLKYNLPKLYKKNISIKTKIDKTYKIDELNEWYKSDLIMKEKAIKI